MLQFNIASNDGNQTSVTVFGHGVPLVATSEHPHFDEIVGELTLSLTGQEVDVEKLVALFDLSRPLKDKFDRLSDRVLIQNGRIFFDGDVIDDALSRAIVDFYLEDNDDFKRLVLFLEKVATNPNEHSRDNLFRWLEQNSFSIASDGDFIAYKGVTKENGSIHRGKAIVDGEWQDGSIPNLPGSIIEMPRGDVQHDPSIGCHTGLHAGTWGYASTFGHGVTLKVKINPRDVVSVPTDCSDQKLRVCRYQVLEATETAYDGLQYDDSGWDGDDDYDGWDEDDDALNAEELEESRQERFDELDDLTRDQVRAIAKGKVGRYAPNGGERTKDQLIQAIVDLEFPLS